jgi:hypothetical protein
MMLETGANKFMDVTGFINFKMMQNWPFQESSEMTSIISENDFAY